MRARDVHLAGLSVELPPRKVLSTELEARLAPVYEALRVHAGRLELMTGIAERRAFEPGTRPSQIASRAARRALESSGVPTDALGVLIHASVCRDFLEPATASVVHANLELPDTCLAFDLSNACLGFVNAIQTAAAMLDSGQIEAALVVAGEDGGPLVDATIEKLLTEAPSRNELKRAFASLTIGAGGAAAVVTSSKLAPGAPRVLGGASRSATEHVALCQGDHAANSSGPLMDTDSEALLHAGCALAARTYPVFLEELGWTRGDVQRVVTHQVGVAHRRALLSALEIDPTLDFPTVEFLGNVGSVALPATLCLALEAGAVRAGERVALLGIGSGLHCSMLGLEV